MPVRNGPTACKVALERSGASISADAGNAGTVSVSLTRTRVPRRVDVTDRSLLALQTMDGPCGSRVPCAPIKIGVDLMARAV